MQRTFFYLYKAYMVSLAPILAIFRPNPIIPHALEQSYHLFGHWKQFNKFRLYTIVFDPVCMRKSTEPVLLIGYHDHIRYHHRWLKSVQSFILILSIMLSITKAGASKRDSTRRMVCSLDECTQ